MRNKVHPERERLARHAEEGAEKLLYFAGQTPDWELAERARVIAQMMLGRAVLLRGTSPVEVVEPDTKRRLLTYADGTYHVIPEG
jgi:hypothetical protein